MPEFNVIAQFDKSPDDQFSQLSVKNWYMTSVSQTAEGSVPYYLSPTPGLSTYLDLTGSQVRALHKVRDTWYAVVDSTFYSIDSNLTATNRGTLETSSGNVSIISNLTQLMIADGLKAYTYTISTNSFAVVSDVDFPSPAPNRLTYLNGYACFTTQGTNALHVMDLNDFTSYTANQYTQFSDSGELVNGCIACNGELYVFTKDRCAIYTNTGVNTFPFEQRSNVLLNYGCASEFSLALADQSVVFVGTNEFGAVGIYRMQGYVVKPLSNNSFNSYLKTITFTDAKAYVFYERGHYFYHVTFPTENKSFRVDLETGYIHEASSRTAQGTSGRHLSNCYTSYGSLNLVGDYKSGKVYSMSSSYYDDAGTIITREIVSTVIKQELERIPLTQVRLDMQVGVGLATGQGSNPQITLQQSDDAGKTWGSERFASMGKVGKYNTLVTWDRLGVARKRTLKIQCSEPVQVALFKLILRY